MKLKLHRKMLAALDRGFIDEYIRQVWHFSRIEPRVSLEIGALDGVYSEILAERFKIRDDQVHLVEPNPDLASGLRSRLPRANLHQVALGVTAGPATMNIVQSDQRNLIGCSTLMQRTDEWGASLAFSQMPVVIETGAKLLQKIASPVDLCVLDVEGLSYEVLMSFGPDIRKIRSFMIECEHREIFKGQQLYPEVAGLLTGYGYEMMAFRYSYSDQSDSIWVLRDFLSLSSPRGFK